MPHRPLRGFERWDVEFFVSTQKLKKKKKSRHENTLIKRRRKFDIFSVNQFFCFVVLWMIDFGFFIRTRLK